MAGSSPPSPFAPKELPNVPAIAGVRIAATEAGIRYAGRKDLLLAIFSPDTVAAGVFTQSRTRSAPVEWCIKCLRQANTARALVVNSGNANAFTGVRGQTAAELTAQAAADAVGCEPEDVYLASTGVIGEPLEAAKFTHTLSELATKAQPGAWHDAAAAIRTTDTFSKLATATCEFDGTPVTIAGIAKGAGMIAPDMATMLSFVFTDAAIAPAILQQLLKTTVDRTFNCITVDSDTSTSDTVMAFATGQAGNAGTPAISDSNDPRLSGFATAFHDVLHKLALDVVKDGEGLTKFVTINITGAESTKAARRIGFAIANSPLVKTAIAGEDPNWGRVVMAIGKAGEAADRDKLEIQFGPYRVAQNGERAPDYVEETVAAYMKNTEIELTVDVGVGSEKATIWTCDLTHEYISINADYRT